jgi:hypothetical protein
MTGGAGFARQGKDQFDNNRKIRQIRTPLKDQAYQQDSKAYSGSLEEYEQLKAWQNQRREEVKKYLGFFSFAHRSAVGHPAFIVLKIICI